MSTDS